MTYTLYRIVTAKSLVASSLREREREREIGRVPNGTGSRVGKDRRRFANECAVKGYADDTPDTVIRARHDRDGRPHTIGVSRTPRAYTTQRMRRNCITITDRFLLYYSVIGTDELPWPSPPHAQESHYIVVYVRRACACVSQ